MAMKSTMAIRTRTILLLGLVGFLCCLESTLSLGMMEQQTQERRGFLARAAPAAIGIHAAFFESPIPLLVPSINDPLFDQSSRMIANAAVGPGLDFFSAISSGKEYQYADAKIGTGDPKTVGDPVMIDYVMSTTGASSGAKIYSTKDSGIPYQWVLGDRSTIPGLEQAVMGGDGVPPMLPGGIRRVIVSGSAETNSEGAARQKLGYDVNVCAEGRGPGPVPRGEVYNKFKNTFCNPTRPDSPELVLDVKLLLPSQISTYVLENE